MENQDEAWLLKEKYQGQKSEGFLADCARLAAGEPLAYIIGHVPFLGTTIQLDSKPLIPRPETEFWVEKAIVAIGADHPQGNSPHEAFEKDKRYILDLCAGSGAIGVAVGQALTDLVEVHFAEIDTNHHATIRRNMNEAGTDDTRIPIFGGHLFNQIKEGPHATFRYHFILSNPPYIDPVVDRTQASVKAHEPHLALYGGAYGMTLITEIISEAPQHLHPHGQLWIEHEPEQAPHIVTLGTKHSFSVTTHPDQYGTLRYSVLVLQ
jgi:release factor glutamine methyltransferase